VTETVLMAGFGGQGVLRSGTLLARAALAAGYETTWFPSYGPEMRGGTANCTVVISDDEIGSPIAGAYDTVIVMNQPSLERFESAVLPDGRLLINASMVPAEPTRTDVRAYRLAAVDMAQALGNPRAANVVMLGAYVRLFEHLAIETVAQIVAESFADKGDDMVQLNLAALRAGAEAVCVPAA